jgi:hypothetical protein
MLVYPDTSGLHLALLSVFRSYSFTELPRAQRNRNTARTAQPNYRARSATELPRAQRNRNTERTAQPNYRARSATEPQRFP